jgi:hypothetical protein
MVFYAILNEYTLKLKLRLYSFFLLTPFSSLFALLLCLYYRTNTELLIESTSCLDPVPLLRTLRLPKSSSLSLPLKDQSD